MVHQVITENLLFVTKLFTAAVEVMLMRIIENEIQNVIFQLLHLSNYTIQYQEGRKKFKGLSLQQLDATFLIC